MMTKLSLCGVALEPATALGLRPSLDLRPEGIMVEPNRPSKPEARTTTRSLAMCEAFWKVFPNSLKPEALNWTLNPLWNPTSPKP